MVYADVFKFFNIFVNMVTQYISPKGYEYNKIIHYFYPFLIIAVILAAIKIIKMFIGGR